MNEDNKQYVTKERKEELQQELESLKTLGRQEISRRIEDAKKFGDLSENAEYMEAKEAQEMNERKIAEMEAFLKNAVLITKTKATGDVQIGSTIEVKSDAGKREFTIVGSEEADPAAGKISNQSPLGSAFLGNREGDTVDVHTPKGIVKYKIVKIH
ncbi:transcription elongation factor GreA [Candidatus Azambacteria bacterium]|nr:transcription elongation factor GreA [Candidatus Azambacteria bacterium]